VRVLFDQGTPVPLREFLQGHEVATAFEMGWSDLSNGDLLAAAGKLRYQQNRSGRKIAVLVLPFASWPKLQGQAAEIAAAVAGLAPGEYAEFQPRAQ
jgi:hypothetical protein